MSEAPNTPEGQTYAGLSEDDLIARLSKWDTACDAHWGDWRKEARESYDLYAGRQWSKGEEDALKDAQRQPVTINRCATIIDAVSGAEIQGRQEVGYYPREVGDSAVNEVLTRGAEWVRDQTDADFEESEATRDAFICGMGWTDTRMDYEVEPEGKILIERVDPLEMCADPGHRKPGCLDARYLRRKKPMANDDFERLFPGKTGARDPSESRNKTINRRRRYEDTDNNDAIGDDEVYVCEWQWYDVESMALTEDPQAEGGVRMVEADEADALESGGVKVVRTSRRRYWRAFTSGETLLGVSELPDGEFTYKCITGKRDRNKRTWFGLMRLMRDPQKWANSFFTQILHIIQTTSKGGVYAEEGAIDDIKQFEETLAKSDRVTLLPEGSLTQGRIQPKPVTPYPQGLERLMELAVNAIRDSTGVNEELLGLVGRDQAGVLEDQRKQAALGVLASFFDSLRRYRRAQGGLLLKLMQHLPQGTLVRVLGQDGTAQYVPMAMQSDTAKFDVIVDEAPTGPDQKRRVWNNAMQLQGILKDLGPDTWSVLLDYSPFPASIVQKFKQVLQAQQQEPPDPVMVAGKQAGVAKVQGEAREAHAKADKAEAEAHFVQQFGPLPDQLQPSPGGPQAPQQPVVGQPA